MPNSASKTFDPDSKTDMEACMSIRLWKAGFRQCRFKQYSGIRLPFTCSRSKAHLVLSLVPSSKTGPFCTPSTPLETREATLCSKSRALSALGAALGQMLNSRYLHLTARERSEWSPNSGQVS